MGISFHGCEFLLPIFQETYRTDATADEIMGDFGGVLKNQSIGVASADGKAYIHTAGKVHDASQLWGNLPILSSRTWAFSPAPTLWLSTKLASTSCSITRLSQAMTRNRSSSASIASTEPISPISLQIVCCRRFL